MGAQMPRPESHPDVEYHVTDYSGAEKVNNDFPKAAALALSVAVARGEAVLDVVIYSEEGARYYGGDDAVERYLEDPEASVFERFEIKVNNAGRIA